jgi:hypothetical protein
VIDQNAYIYVSNYLHINTMPNKGQTSFNDIAHIALGAEENGQEHRVPKAHRRNLKMTSRCLLLFLLLMVGVVFAIINFVLLSENVDAPTTSKRVVAEFVHRGVFDDDKIHRI